MKFEIVFGKERLITPTGLALAGLLLKKTDLYKRLNNTLLKENASPIIKNGDVAHSYIGLLCQGKSAFESIREMHEDKKFYRYALGVSRLPSEGTLRQRMDSVKGAWREIILEENTALLTGCGVVPAPCYDEFIPLDIDVSPHDNSNTKKEGVSRTYKGVNGFAPIYAYLGEEGYLINAQLRQGSEHCQKGTDIFLQSTLAYAKKVTKSPLLVRMDSGNDCNDNMRVCYDNASDFIIKRNLRRESPEAWLDIAKAGAAKTYTPREGKTVYTGSMDWYVKKLDRKVRIVYQVTERSITKEGQILLLPEIEADLWWTSLNIPEEAVISLYKAHGTSEQFHSEIKTDMDLERLPSGYFQTNALVLEFAVLAYNILRIIGQTSLKTDVKCSRKSVARRRLRTVIQNLINIAAKVVRHARKDILSLGKSNVWRFAFKQIYDNFA